MIAKPKDTVSTAMLGLKNYDVRSKGRIQTAVRDVQRVTKTVGEFKNRTKNQRTSRYQKRNDMAVTMLRMVDVKKADCD